jgi:hypothetical protein
LIDNVGFGFEGYDAMGVWRTTENGKPIDARGELIGTDVDGPFTGAVELAGKLVTSPAVHACFARQLFTFGAGRGKTDDDACTVRTLETALARSGGDLRALLMQLVQTDAFFFLPETLRRFQTSRDGTPAAEPPTFRRDKGGPR